MSLQLLNSEEKVVRPTRRPLVIAWRERFKVETGRNPAMPWGEMMNRMKGKFEGVDEETGEVLIEYPDEETWKFEMDGFFKDEYAQKNGYGFSYFLSKRYGSFGKYVKVEPAKKQTPRLEDAKPFRCSDCKQIRPATGDCVNPDCPSNEWKRK